MKITCSFLIFFFALGWNGNYILGQSEFQLEVDASESVAKVQPTMYGIFFEDINFAADGGLYAEMVKNRGFEFTLPLMGWEQPKYDRFSLNTNSGIGTIIKTEGDPANRNFLCIIVNNDQNYDLINEGFRGMGIKKGDNYKLSLKAKQVEGSISAIHVAFIDNDGKELGKTTLSIVGKDWKTYQAEFNATATEAKAKLKITFSGTGTVDLDMISLFPEDTWMGREKGLRKDLVQLLADLKPGFLRFPGGCIVEGRTLARRYQWKKTVGSIDERELLVNRWNTEFNHRPTPDYYQSFGIGFFEYFQLAEDIGATPLPILSCGIACQFNTGELVPMDELNPYIQDAVDLIEFANGPVDSPWGEIRAEMGHPAPFNMKYIGVGNEQWGPEYIKRFVEFEKAIKAAYPEIVIVSGSGPFPDGEKFEFGWQELKKLNAEIVDEHYYRPPSWFKENTDRYDNYDHSGPKIFAGEYAAQSVAIASPDNKNNWNCALSEAAFMTGLERNADLVVMTSYAPLMEHAEGWQWTPDMIWFNNLKSYGTANYYVQKLYSTNPGKDLIKVSHNGEKVIGQDDIYSSATIDADKNEIILKVVNTAGKAQNLNISINGKKVSSEVVVLTLQSEDLEAENSFEEPMKISPKSSEIAIKKGKLQVQIPGQAMVVYRIPIKK